MLTHEPDHVPDLSVCVQRNIFRIGWRSPVRAHEMASKLGQKISEDPAMASGMLRWRF